MEENILEPVPDYKLYTEQAIRGATFFGGPLIAGYLISENFKSLGLYEKGRTTWLLAIGATVLIFGGIFLIPDTANIPNYVIPLIYAWTASLIARQTQGAFIKKHIDTGGQLFSFWRIALIAIIGAAVTTGIILLLLLAVNKQLPF